MSLTEHGESSGVPVLAKGRRCFLSGLSQRCERHEFFGNVRITGDKEEFSLGQRLLRMDVGVSNQLEDLRCLLVVMEADFKFFVDIPKSLDATILSGRNLSPCVNDFRFASSEFLVVVEFVIVSIF